MTNTQVPVTIEVSALTGSAQRCNSAAVLPASTGYSFAAAGDGLSFQLPPGTLASAKYLWFDLLLSGIHGAHFELSLFEAGSVRAFRFQFGALNECTARLRMPVEAMSLNAWALPREGACVKRTAYGDRVAPENVDRMTLQVVHKNESPVVFCITKVVLSSQEPAKLEKLMLPQGVLIDELGQSTLHTWAGKSKSSAEVTARLKQQEAAASGQTWPKAFSRWGGDAWTKVLEKAPGFFRTHFDGSRWWLVDPDGYRFWSTGPDCVTPGIQANYQGLESVLQWLPTEGGEFDDAMFFNRGMKQIDFLRVNFIRAFGKDWRAAWEKIVLGQMRHLMFNTAANWSDWAVASKNQFPYVRPLDMEIKHSKPIFRDFPDVFDPAFSLDAEAMAQPLKTTCDDPALIGYFLMNEPTWGFAKQNLAEGILLTTKTCRSRDALAEYLQTHYASDAALAQAWEMPVTFAHIREGLFIGAFSEPAVKDLENFSMILVEKLWHGLSDACRKVDPNHLNLGARYYTVPPAWAFRGMDRFDVFSMNCYADRVEADKVQKVTAAIHRPVLIGEWHFGALDVGLPCSGIGRVKDQAARGQAYRYYTEQAAALKACVGVHYFTLYDQSALGRFDGENYNIGFFDVCHRPYEEICRDARRAHERLYDVAAGKEPPFNDPPAFLPKLFF